MSEEQITCPYCNAPLSEGIEQCPNCGEHFKEISIPLKIDSLGKFVVFNVITLGLYQYIWLLFNLKNINKMIVKEKDKKKLNFPIIILAIISLICVTDVLAFKIFGMIELPQNLAIIHFLLGKIIGPTFFVLGLLLTYIITYRTVRIIERYTKNKYNKEISHSDTWMFFSTLLFMPLLSPMFYLIYFIYTFKERVYNPKSTNV